MTEIADSDYRQLCRGLVICIPTIDWSSNTGVIRLLSVAMQLGASMLSVDNMRPNEYARNILVGMFLRQKPEKARRLWFIDSDMVPCDEALEMLKVDGDLVSARCLFSVGTRYLPGQDSGLALQLNGFHHIKDRKPPFVPVTKRVGVEDVDACGTAALLIKRRVLEDRSIWNDGKYHNWLDGKDYDCAEANARETFTPPLFKARHAPNGMPMLSQDVDFTWRAKQAGYSIKYAHDIRFGHLKKMNMDVILDYVDAASSRFTAKDT